MTITFLDVTHGRILEPARAEIEDVLRQAIQAARPEHDHWRVTMREIAGGQVQIYDFALGVETPRSLTLSMRRFRLTNAFSKELENRAVLALYFMDYSPACIRPSA